VLNISPDDALNMAEESSEVAHKLMGFM